MISQLLKVKEVFFETKHIRKDGTDFPVEVNSQCSKLGNKSVLISIIRDITDRKRHEEALHESESKYRSLFNTAKNAIVLTEITSEGPLGFKMIDVNESACKLLGYTKDEMQGLGFADFSKRNDQSELIKKIFSQGHHTFESVHVTKDGREVPVEANAQYVEISGKRCILTFARDITERIRGITALRENEEKFRLLFQNANDAIFVYELNEAEMQPGKYIEVNDVACERLGYSREELLQLSPLDINGPVSRDNLPNSYREFLTGGQSRWTIEATHISKSGVEIPVEVNAHYFTMNGNKVMLSICRDISQWKLAQKSQAEYRALFMNMHSGFTYNKLICNEFGEPIDCVFIEVNEAYAKMYNMDRQDILDKKYSKVFPHLHSEEIKGRLALCAEVELTGSPKVLPEYYSSSNNSWLLVGLYSLERGSFFTINTDITAQKQVEFELKKAKEDAEAANRAKSELLANMSREIRTPINGMSGMIDLTLLTELNDEQKENLDTAKTCADSLLRIINDILDFSKMEAGKLVIEEIGFDIKELVEDTIKTHTPRATQKELELNYALSSSIPKIVNGDPERLRQVLNNLLNNAIKFTSCGEVTLSVKKAAISNEEVELSFSVTDSGIGISEEEQSRLFKTFSQVDGSITRKYGGTGLGLVISKQLVEMMGGKLRVMSIKVCGSTFLFNLKFNLNGEIRSKPQVSSIITKAQKPFNILIVEDDKVNLTVITRILKEKGHSVDTANNGLEALKLHKQKRYDTILMDIQMPQMDGIEATRRIRERESLSSHTPIIALTAHALHGDRERFLSLGMDEYLSKPINMNDLFQLIDHVITKDPTNHEVRISNIGKVIIENRKNNDGSLASV